MKPCRDERCHRTSLHAEHLKPEKVSRAKQRPTHCVDCGNLIMILGRGTARGTPASVRCILCLEKQAALQRERYATSPKRTAVVATSVRRRHCSYCGEAGHYKRTCPRRRSAATRR